jgi:ribosomal protein L31E
VRVNLIRSILVFQEKKYCLHDNVKLVFFKKKYTKTIYTIKKKITRTVQVNCTVHVNTKFKKAAWS